MTTKMRIALGCGIACIVILLLCALVLALAWWLRRSDGHRAAVAGATDSPAAAGLQWEWFDPFPGGANLHAVWGCSANDVFAVGDWGTILHHDGRSWSRMESGKPCAALLTGSSSWGAWVRSSTTTA